MNDGATGENWRYTPHMSWHFAAEGRTCIVVSNPSSESLLKRGQGLLFLTRGAHVTNKYTRGRDGRFINLVWQMLLQIGWPRVKADSIRNMPTRPYR